MAAINLPIVSKFDNKGVRQAEGAFDGLGKKLLGLGGLVAGAVSAGAIANFGKESIAAAEGVATANARIDNIAESMGIFGKDASNVSKRLQGFAESNEMALATDAELIKSTQAKLLTFKELAGTADETGGAFDRATLAAVDLAAAGFGSAESNAVQLGKALNDPVKGISALTRSGITFTDAEKEKIKTLTESGDVLAAQDLVLKAIETQVGGTAEATANASDKMKLAFDNIKETTGAALLPAFETFTDALLPLVEHFLPILETFISEKIAPGLQALADNFKAFTTGLMDGTVTFETVTADIGNFIKNGIEKAAEFLSGDGLTNLLSSFMEIRSAVFEAIINLVPIVLDTLVELLPKIVQTIADMLPEILNQAIETFMALVDAVVIILPKLLKAILDMLPDIITTIIDLLPGIIKSGIELFNGLITALVEVIPDLIEAFVDATPKILDAIIAALPKIIDAAFKLFMGLAQGLLNATPNILSKLMDLIPKMLGGLLGTIPKFVDAGLQILGGLVKGIVDNVPRLLGNAIDAIGDTLVTGVNKILGIKSPSRVFMGIGENVVEGFEKGLLDGQRLLSGASVEMAQNVKLSAVGELSDMQTLSVSPVGVAPSSGGNTVLNVTVNAGMGADGSEIGRKIVDEILRFERSSGRVFARA